MIPSVGRIVHYTSLGSGDENGPPEQQAAIVISVKKMPLEDPTQHTERDYEVCLHIFDRAGAFFRDDVPFSDTYEPDHWTWPKQVS